MVASAEHNPKTTVNAVAGALFSGANLYCFLPYFLTEPLSMPSATNSKKTKKATEAETTSTEVAVETKPKRTRKSAAEPRVKLYWGVFNQHLKRVAVFEYTDVKKAEKHAKELSKDGGDHFLQKIKEVVG